MDYYEFQLSADDGVTWNDMPATAVGEIPRQYWIPATNTFHGCHSSTRSRRTGVFMKAARITRPRMTPATWGITRFWMAQLLLGLMNWHTRRRS